MYALKHASIEAFRGLLMKCVLSGKRLADSHTLTRSYLLLIIPNFFSLLTTCFFANYFACFHICTFAHLHISTLDESVMFRILHTLQKQSFRRYIKVHPRRVLSGQNFLKLTRADLTPSHQQHGPRETPHHTP
jgi:hypothetical protein